MHKLSVAALLLGLPAVSLSQPQIAIGGYAIPTAHGYPVGITAAPHGALWFTEFGNKIGRITTAGAITEYSVPTPTVDPQGITPGPDGALWFTESSGNKIGRLTTAGVFTEYPVPTANSLPQGITAGPDGALWFAESNGNKIGRITTAGAITEYPVPAVSSGPSGITAGPDGALWFTESYGPNIGRITTAGVITEYPVPTFDSVPSGITAGPDGALWFTEWAGDKIGRITTNGAATEYPVPTANSAPVGITAGPDGALWFTELAGNKIGRITTAGTISEYPVPVCNANNYCFSEPDQIAAGPDGALWFTNGAGDSIGQAVFVTAGLSVSPASGHYQTNLTLTGSAFAPNESVKIFVSGIGSAALAAATADSTGAFTVTARNPQTPYGPRLFLGAGQTSGRVGAASFSINPRLILEPNSGPVGSAVTAQGYGFGSLEQVKVNWQNPSTLVGTATANVNGTFALTFTVPTGAPAGSNMVVGKGQKPGPTPTARAVFTVQ